MRTTAGDIRQAVRTLLEGDAVQVGNLLKYQERLFLPLEDVPAAERIGKEALVYAIDFVLDEYDDDGDEQCQGETCTILAHSVMSYYEVDCPELKRRTFTVHLHNLWVPLDSSIDYRPDETLPEDYYAL